MERLIKTKAMAMNGRTTDQDINLIQKKERLQERKTKLEKQKKSSLDQVIKLAQVQIQYKKAFEVLEINEQEKSRGRHWDGLNKIEDRFHTLRGEHVKLGNEIKRVETKIEDVKIEEFNRMISSFKSLDPNLTAKAKANSGKVFSEENLDGIDDDKTVSIVTDICDSGASAVFEKKTNKDDVKKDSRIKKVTKMQTFLKPFKSLFRNKKKAESLDKPDLRSKFDIYNNCGDKEIIKAKTHLLKSREYISIPKLSDKHFNTAIDQLTLKGGSLFYSDWENNNERNYFFEGDEHITEMCSTASGNLNQHYVVNEKKLHEYFDRLLKTARIEYSQATEQKNKEDARGFICHCCLVMGYHYGKVEKSESIDEAKVLHYLEQDMIALSILYSNLGKKAKVPTIRHPKNSQDYRRLAQVIERGKKARQSISGAANATRTSISGAAKATRKSFNR